MALITAAEARILQPHLSGTGEDTDLDALITRAGRAFARFCHYPSASAGANPTMETTSYTLYSGVDCQVVDNGQTLICLPAPVTAVASIYDDNLWSYGSGTLITSTDYQLEGDQGRIRMTPLSTWGSFSSGHRNIKISCTAGFTTVPDDLKMACALQVRRWWDQRRLEVGDTTMEKPLDPQVAAMIKTFRRYIMRGM